ncbi:MAG: hypothetical protein AAF770_01750 [Bacteroidota bacterium]
MKYSPTQILRFLATNYPAVEALVQLGKSHNYLISESQLTKIKQKYAIKDQLIAYKIVKPLPQGSYQLEERYTAFFNFLVGDFSLNLPEQLAKYDQAIKELMRRLQRAEEQSAIELIAKKLIEEMTQFLNHLDESTAALEKEVDELRTQQKEKHDPQERIYRASYLIDTFLQPLNTILEDHPDAISRTFSQLRVYAHEKVLLYPDTYRHAPYHALHQHLLLAHHKIEGHLRNLIRSLLPLLEQIKMSNRVLAGLKNLRDFYSQRQHERYLDHLPHMIKAHRNQTYSYYREADAQALLDEISNNLPITLHPLKKLPPLWRFESKRYKKALLANLPIDNFYDWCYQALKQETRQGAVQSYQFFQVANLMLDLNLSLTFTQNRTMLNLEDRVFSIPQIQVAHAIS